MTEPTRLAATAPPGTIQAVLWDLGGVMIEWNPRHLYRKLIPDEGEREAFLASVCTPDWNVAQDAGRPIAVANALLIERFPEHRALIEAFYGRWHEMLDGAIEGSVALFDRLKAACVPCFALTNWSAETFPWALELFEFLHRFDGRLVSGEEKLVKPDPAIFHLAAQRFGLDPARTLFIDDGLRNVTSAASLGFRTHHFQGPEGLAAEMRRLGLPV